MKKDPSILKDLFLKIFIPYLILLQVVCERDLKILAHIIHATRPIVNIEIRMLVPNIYNLFTKPTSTHT
jgi:hypothetical protein